MEALSAEESFNQNPPKIQIEFKGTASEYFRIWIVNVLLTILTLGIYSAWAKVRKRKYFYRNTYLSGDSFDYHADPIKILIGRMIIGVFGLAYTVGPYISPIVSLIAFFLFIALFPWLIVRGAIFNYRNTSFRNIRFNFLKKYKSSYANYGLAVLIQILTLGLGFPYFFYRHYKFTLNNITFGKQKFNFIAKKGSFFSIYYGAILCYIVIVMPMGGILAAIMGGIDLSFGTDLTGGILLTALIVVISYIGMFLIYAYQKAHLSNLISRQTNLSKVKFYSDLKVLHVAYLYITNFLAVVFTLGLATPWAKIRVLKYRLEHTYVIANPDDLNQFVAHEEQAEGQVADAAADFWDIDLGL